MGFITYRAFKYNKRSKVFRGQASGRSVLGRSHKRDKKSWPTIQEDHRAELLASIRSVDETYVYSNLDQSAQLAKFNVSVFVIGEEFGSQGIEEHELALDYCKRNGIEVIRVGRFNGISTTLIKENIK